MSLHLKIDEADLFTLLSGDVLKRGDISINLDECNLSRVLEKVRLLQVNLFASGDSRIFHLINRDKRAVCGLFGKSVPSNWPSRHKGTSTLDRVTCEECKLKGSK